MSRQTFISNPKFDKTYIYKSPNTKYQQFTNAFAYHFMVENENLIPSRLSICDTAAKEWKNIKMFEKTKIDDIIKGYLATSIKLKGFIGSHAVTAIPVEQEILNNAPVQKRVACSIEAAKTKLKELKQEEDNNVKKEEKKLNQRNFDNKKEQDFNKSTNTSVLWSWIEKHCSLCQYLIDIKRCTNLSCCGPTRVQEAMDFLQPFDGFLLPVTKARDGHYINPVHLLQYSERFKVPDYDEHCPSINQTMYSRLCCSICYKYFSTLSYVAKHKRLQHSSNHRKARKEPEISESVAEFVIISILQLWKIWTYYSCNKMKVIWMNVGNAFQTWKALEQELRTFFEGISTFGI
ncbi:11459_t:CDS:2 [Dentiscutata erythropus]|uniref:11459_t:CDS:1 n=1 Tax=Dentiscutata erythropus TaxID=1348616 RepID=A0A9N9IGU0_9GLOM|nr:11459_t:CDS:2 [Dentiscutata erythropus]